MSNAVNVYVNVHVNMYMHPMHRPAPIAQAVHVVMRGDPARQGLWQAHTIAMVAAIDFQDAICLRTLLAAAAAAAAADPNPGVPVLPTRSSHDQLRHGDTHGVEA